MLAYKLRKFPLFKGINHFGILGAWCRTEICFGLCSHSAGGGGEAVRNALALRGGTVYLGCKQTCFCVGDFSAHIHPCPTGGAYAYTGHKFTIFNCRYYSAVCVRLCSEVGFTLCGDLTFGFLKAVRNRDAVLRLVVFIGGKIACYRVNRFAVLCEL